MIVAIILAFTAFFAILFDLYVYEFLPEAYIPDLFDYILNHLNENFLQPIFTGLRYIKDFLFLIIEKAQDVIEWLLKLGN